MTPSSTSGQHHRDVHRHYHPSAMTIKHNAVRRRQRPTVKGVGSLVVAIWIVLAFWFVFVH